VAASPVRVMQTFQKGFLMRGILGKTIAGAASVMMIMSAMACGSSSADSEQSNEVGGEITIWTWEQPGKAFAAVAKGFESAHKGTTVKVENVGNPAIWDKITTGLAAGGQGLPDIMNVGIDYIGGYMDKFPDAFADMSQYGADDVKDDFPSGIMKSATRDGKIYGLPFEVNTGALVYDVNMFKEAGINEENIKTWDDFIAAGKQLKERTGNYMFGLNKACIGSSACADAWQIITALQNSFYFNTQGDITMNSSAGIHSMQLLKEANDAGIVAELPGSSDDNSWIAKQGNIATFVDRSYLPGVLKTQFPEYANRWKVAQLPAASSSGLRSVVPGGTYLSIAQSSKNQKTAWEFIKYALTTEKGQDAMYKAQGLFPGYLPYIKQHLNVNDAYFNGQNVNEVFIKQLEDKTPELNFTADYNKALKALTDAQVKVLTKGASPKSAIDDAASRLAQETGRKIA
jgi:lactose/L-arabinose transport system substrate-binding protein